MKRISAWVSMARVHQWTKNLLIFVPLVTAFALTDPVHLRSAFLAFLAFSFLASATYIGNDWKDLENDRAHPRKRNRAIASGMVSIPESVAVAALLLAAATAASWSLGPRFQLMMLGYVGITAAYSLLLKGYFLLDVIVIAMLYMWRILAGAVAIEVTASSWLLAFSTLFFFGLALIKRCAELHHLDAQGKTSLAGRDYQSSDYGTLQSIGVSACVSAVVVFCLFINSPEVRERYATPEVLWLVACALLYWSTRLWVKTSRGLMHDDPIVYSLRDRGSRILLSGSAVCMLIARYWHAPSI
jgi:4-hydroxybenzoate polyprenyltransferase